VRISSLGPVEPIKVSEESQEETTTNSVPLDRLVLKSVPIIMGQPH